MAEIETIILYDGPALANHDMDVEKLAPALLALASLIQNANHKFNGDTSAVRVTVNADLDQQCFQLKIKLVQDVLSAARSFLGGDVATLKEICEWIGIIGGGAFSLFRVIIALGKKQQDSTVLQAKGGDDSTVIQAGTIENLHVHLPGGTPKQVEALLKDPAIVSRAKEVLKPVAEPGYESVSFVDPKKGEKAFEAGKEEVRAALAYEPPESPPDPDDDEHNPVHVRVFVKTQRNEGRAQWELKWGGVAHWVSMDHAEWLDRFQAGHVPHTIPFYLDVLMDVITSKSNPDAPARYHVLKVIDVINSPTGTQEGLFDK